MVKRIEDPEIYIVLGVMVLFLIMVFLLFGITVMDAWKGWSYCRDQGYDGYESAENGCYRHREPICTINAAGIRRCNYENKEHYQIPANGAEE